ncbi:hypothetical protein FRC17_002998 [Serendipita sp. 399]|nr:hypothetical protein FRC17_002998 [Serendipita sp. 399]
MSPSYKEMHLAALHVILALHKIGESWCCLVGGMAAKLHGVQRDRVKDLDIAVLRSGRSQAEIKRRLCKYDPEAFFLELPRRKNADFLLLKYEIREGCRIRIDLLLHNNPEAEIPPSLHWNHFEWISSMPVAPLYFVLYHKLLGWEWRMGTGEGWRVHDANNKDYEDIIQLCDLLRDQSIVPLSKSHLGRAYLKEFPRRARLFANTYGEARRRLYEIGFDVRSNEQSDSSYSSDDHWY